MEFKYAAVIKFDTHDGDESIISAVIPTNCKDSEKILQIWLDKHGHELDVAHIEDYYVEFADLEFIMNPLTK